jgi:cysteine-rich repeat protein
MKRAIASVLATLVCGGIGCSGRSSGQGDELTGTAQVAITAAPSDGTCIQINADGFRTVTQSFDVAVGMSTVLQMSGLPLGTVIFSANATTGPCSMVPAGAVPNWVSDTVTTTVAVAPPVNVLLAMHRNGNAMIGVDFPNEPADGGPSGDGGSSTPTTDASPDAVAMMGAVCGNGVIETGEQCDDGNTLNLDGCDSRCNYEVVTRFTSLAISGSAAPAGCIPSTNTLGTRALASITLGQLNSSVQTAVTNGSVNMMMQFLGLGDLTGVNASGLALGFTDATPDPAKGAFPGNNPIDWWFLVDPTTVAAGLPTATLPAQITSRALTAGPGTATLSLDLGGAPAPLTVQNALVRAAIDTSPAADVPAPPPLQLASGLVVFQTITANGAGQGLCGNVTVGSLAQVPVPAALTTGTAACSQGYTACPAGMPAGPNCNSFLDVIVGGCTLLGGLVTAVIPTQPDVGANGMPPTTLIAGAQHKVVLTPADQGDAYSSMFAFTANRAHFTGETCQNSAQCQAGQTCMAGVCK